MFRKNRKAVIIAGILIITTAPLYAQNVINPGQKPVPYFRIIPAEGEYFYITSPNNLRNNPKEKVANIFLNFINQRIYGFNLDKNEERNNLREEWKKLLNIDIFFPYFKAKEVENWVSDKASLNFFKIKGKPKIENNQIKYTFKIKF